MKQTQKTYSFTDILNDANGHEIVDQLEDVLSSLSSYGGKEKSLLAIAHTLNNELKAKFGRGYIHEFLK